MGIPHSKPKKRAADKKKTRKFKKSKKTRKPATIQATKAEQEPEIPADLAQMNYNEYLTRIMKAQIAQDVPAFLSNQILLSMQFFGNYERFIASGDSVASISFLFRVGRSTASEIISECMQAIWEVLSPIVFEFKEDMFPAIAAAYEKKWFMPNCIGAIDGKHIQIQPPPNSGSTFYKYKKKISIVLLAVTDASCKFLYCDIGAYGKQSDGGRLRASSLWPLISKGFKDKSQAMDRISATENQINEKLSKHYVMLPYVIDNAVDTCIKFDSRSSTRKRQPLQLPVMYVVFKNIEILRMSDGDYEWISQCKFVLDTRRGGPTEKFGQCLKGYVKLMSWEIASKNELARNDEAKKRLQRMAAGSEDSFSEEDEEGVVNAHAVSTQSNLYSEKGSVYSGNANRCTSIYNASNRSSSEYDYAYITHLNTHQPLKELQNAQGSCPEADTAEIPEECMTPISAIIGRNVPESRTDAFYDYLMPNEMSFLDSKAFWTYFANTLRGDLAVELGLSESDLDKATYKGASIFTPSCEIVPAIHHAGWPLCAEGWKWRLRPERIHPYTKQKIRWPDSMLIDRVTSFGCHLVPAGYAPKNGKNHFRELEWKVVFPKAEQYLESCLTSAQAKIFMISKVLIKSFVEPEQNGETYMFSIDHLRAHLFWECEKDFLAWPEEFLGEKLIYFLKSFLLRLQCNELPDYFIEKRNLFEYVPEKCLSELHDIISRIVHNPAIHLMVAYRNLDFVKDFFPKFKIKSLYSALTIEQSLYLFSRKANTIKDYSYKEMAQKTTEAMNESLAILPEPERESDEGVIRTQKKKEDRKITKKLMKNEKRQIQHRMASLRKPTANLIDLAFILPKKLESIKREDPDQMSIKRETCDNLRRIYIIDLFAQFYIEMAHRSFQQFANNRQTEMYLVQADALCTLLEGYKDYLKAKDLREKIVFHRRAYQEYKTHGITSNKRSDSDNYISIDENINSLGQDTNEPSFEPRSFDIRADVHSETPSTLIGNVSGELPKLNGLIRNMGRLSRGTGPRPKEPPNSNGFADESEILSTLVEAKPAGITKLNGFIRDKDEVDTAVSRKIKFKQELTIL